jgi:hypothetical protein
MATTRPTIPDRMQRTALLPWLTLVAWMVLSACIDERLSLGHHQTPLAPGAGMLPDMSSSGGAGGTGGLGGIGGQSAPALDAGAIDAGTIDPEPDAAPPALQSACEGSVYAATLRCAMSPPGPQGSMITQTLLTLEPVPFGGPSGRAAVRGELDFDAWDLSFRARLVGELDCSRGDLHVDVVDGRAELSAMPGPDIAFIGGIDGMLMRQDDTLEGGWWHAPSSGGPGCTGVWSAVRQN